MRKILFLLFVGCVICFNACDNNNYNKEVKKIIRAWEGKTIKFPVDIQPKVLGDDTLWLMPETPYKILVYTDSVGCISCKLLMAVWRSYINEVDTTMKKVSLLIPAYNEEASIGLLYEGLQAVMASKPLCIGRLHGNHGCRPSASAGTDSRNAETLGGGLRRCVCPSNFPRQRIMVA